MTSSSFKRVSWRHCLFAVAALLLYGAFLSRAELTVDGAGGPAAVPVAPAPAQLPPGVPAGQPTRAGSKYVCDWKRPRAAGMAEVRFEYTRQTGPTGWVGKLLTTYPDGNRREEKIQLFNPRFVRRIGTEWDFQTTDGKIKCKMTVSRGSGEVRFGKCSNEVEQYCVDQRLLDIANEMPNQPCAECASQGVFNRVQCVARCMGRLSGDATVPGCAMVADPRTPPSGPRNTPVACMLVTLLKVMQTVEPPQWSRDRLTYYGLLDMQLLWVDFVNKQLGPCESSHLCPFGTVCDGKSCVTLREN